MDIGIVGCGAVAGRYAEGLGRVDSPDARVVAAADRDRHRAAAIAESFDCEAYADAGTMLDDAGPDLVVNLTSHAAHAPVTETCLRAGCHVFSEKPLALDPERARELVTLATERDLALGCAPINPRCEQQCRAARLLGDGRTGEVGHVYATAHVGRVTDWHDSPDSFLGVGPLYDGGVYPLTLLVEWFGPVTEVRRADATTRYPGRAGVDPDAPTHVEATLAFGDGPVVSLRASLYVPHRSREFYSLEVHGDDGSLYLADAGGMGGRAPDDHGVEFGRVGREYTPVPLGHPPRATPHAAGPLELAASVRRARPSRVTARRAAHVVAVCDAVETAAEQGGTVPVGGPEYDHGGLPGVAVRPPGTSSDPGNAPSERDGPGDSALRLPPVGVGVVDAGSPAETTDALTTALDAGYRLLDAGGGVAHDDPSLAATLGDLLAAPGAPDRERVVLACRVSPHREVGVVQSRLDALGVEAFDLVVLDRSGPKPGDGQSLPRDWRALESLVEDGRTRALGLGGVDAGALDDLLTTAGAPPAVVRCRRTPSAPRNRLVDRCHEQGIRVLAEVPPSNAAVHRDATLTAVAARHDATPAGVLVAWHRASGVVPVVRATDPERVVAGLAAAGLSLTDAERERIADRRTRAEGLGADDTAERGADDPR